MQSSIGTPHLDPLPSSDEGRGNPIAPASRAPAWVAKRDLIFPLSFTRGEHQGEGLIRRPFDAPAKPRRSRRREEADSSKPKEIRLPMSPERGQPCPRVSCALAGTRGQGCPRSGEMDRRMDWEFTALRLLTSASTDRTKCPGEKAVPLTACGTRQWS